MKETLARVAVALAAVVLVVISICWAVGSEFLEPYRHDIGRPPPDLEASNITFASSSGFLIHGWLARGEPGHGVVLLLHGLRSDRRAMLPRAQFLRKRGYSVLLIDFEGHGESRGGRFSFGDMESRDVVAAIQYLHHKLPAERIGVIGVSLGAAAFILAERRPAVDAVVLETVYPDFRQAVSDRLRLHVAWIAPAIAPVLAMQMRPRLDSRPDRLDPLAHISNVHEPVLFADGTRGSRPSGSETRPLYEAASAPKEIWEVPGGAHHDLHNFERAEYEQRIADFLGRYLPKPAGSNPPPGPETSPSG